MPPKKPAAVVKKTTTTTKSKTPAKMPAKKSTTKTTAVKKQPEKAPAKEPEKAPAKEPEKEPEVEGISIKLAALSKELMDDTAAYRKTSRWPLVYDVSGNSATFLEYRDCNIIKAMNPSSLSLETIRMAVIGGIRYGKPVVLNMDDCDLFDTCVTKFDEVQKGLMADILSKEILKNEKYLSLVKESDGPEFKANKFPSEIKNFIFIIVSKISPPDSLKKQVFVVEIS